ncbi:ATP:ADP Antiporter (AAA) Family [Pseudoloma neurophilia]|uniref:ADP,ATP carrier protein n=1 Tax=Pseudoloma neurophilia TaxID=146866 RepID=A0A0R0LW24_9MICR|nr:ATP:ADP Antiporter (AAA) Family [Pseudoloma neurophilia]
MEVDNPQKNLPTETQVEEEARAIGRKTFNIWNVAPRECPKLLLMSTQFFLISYVYAILRELKDAFTLKRQLAASIQVMKLWFVPPVSIVASLTVAKLLSYASNRKILMGALCLYAAYFLFYGFIILPYQDKIEPSVHRVGDVFHDSKMKFRGIESLAAVIVTFTCYTSTVHFIMSEVWGSAVLSLLFLSFVNDVCPFKQFIRFIRILYISSNLALIFSFLTIKGFEFYDEKLSFIGKGWLLIGMFVFLSFVVLIVVLLGYIFKIKNFDAPLFIVESEKKKKKVSVSFGEGIRLMFKSKLVLAICCMTLAYSIGTNMAETNYKSCLDKIAKNERQSTTQIAGFLAYQQVIVGVIVIILLCTPFARLIQIFGWTTMGLVPSVAAFFSFLAVFSLATINTGIDGRNMRFINAIFLSFDISNEKTNNWLYSELYVGLVAASCFKITKYAAFDIAKEAISMRINRKYRARFKGIYDGVCGKLGKAGGSMLSAGCNLFMNANDIRSSSLIYFCLSMVLVAAWVYVIIYLGGKYYTSIKNDEDIDIDVIGGKKGSAFDDDEQETAQDGKYRDKAN